MTGRVVMSPRQNLNAVALEIVSSVAANVLCTVTTWWVPIIRPLGKHFLQALLEQLFSLHTVKSISPEKVPEDISGIPPGLKPKRRYHCCQSRLKPAPFTVLEDGDGCHGHGPEQERVL